MQANQLLPPLKQPTAAEGDAAAATEGGSGASGPTSNGSAVDNAVDEDQLARCVGYFLRVCPGLSKVTIGELLGDPDKFFLKVWGALRGWVVLTFTLLHAGVLSINS